MCRKQVEVKVKRLRPDVPLPRYMTELAAGMDLCAAEEVVLEPGAWRLVPTGIALALPPGYEAQLRPRSGLALQEGIALLNAPGTVDADYRGEVRVILVNLGPRTVRIRPGERIAQMVIARAARARLVEVDELPPTGRAEGGFGHTGR